MTSSPYFKNPNNIPVKVTDEQGREVYKYPDGSIKEVKSGHWIMPAPKYKITPENSALRKQQRKELNQAAAEEGVLEALREHKDYRKVASGADATRIIAKVVTRIMLNSKHDRDRLDASEKVLKMADLLPREIAENTTNILNVDPETARSIVLLVQQLSGGAPVVPEIIDMEEEKPNDRKWV